MHVSTGISFSIQFYDTSGFNLHVLALITPAVDLCHEIDETNHLADRKEETLRGMPNIFQGHEK